MRDIKAHIDMLRISWIKRLICNKNTEDSWTQVPKLYFNKFGENLLVFKMNIRDVRRLPGILNIPEFYRQILNSWTNLNKISSSPKENTGIQKEILWGNDSLLFKGKSLMFKNWIESGIITVNDIINDRGEISEGLILDKLRIKTNWISEVNIMYKSFPKEWKRILHENKNKKRFNQNSEFNIYNPIDKKETNLKDVNNKILYQILLNRVTTKSFAIDTWVNEFNLTNAQKSMNAFKFISQKIAENDERIYRWKLLHRILPNGILLHYWKILPSNVCLKCQVREDYLHYRIAGYFCGYKFLRFGHRID